ncbi:hypothetical protein YC2023_061577 [Brassica napus]
MIIENGINHQEELKEVLICYLRFNTDEYHVDMNINMFQQMFKTWEKIMEERLRGIQNDTYSKIGSEETGVSVEKVKAKWWGKLRSTRIEHILFQYGGSIVFQYCPGSHDRDHSKLVNKPKTKLNQHAPIPDSARKEYFRIDHMLNNRSICKKMVDLLCQHEPIPDSARKEVFRDKRLNEIVFADVDALWSIKMFLLLIFWSNSLTKSSLMLLHQKVRVSIPGKNRIMRIKRKKDLQEICSMAQGIPSSVDPIGRLR